MKINLAILFAVLCCFTLVTSLERLEKSQVETYYNVEILNKIGPNEWLLLRQDGMFRYRGCKDFDNNGVIGVGFVAKKVKFMQFGDCESIKGEGLGFFYDNPPKEIYPGSGEKRIEWENK